MRPELSKQVRSDAVASIRQYFEENMAEPIGELAAGSLLDFVLEEIGPVIYNQAIRDAQTRVQQSIVDLDADLYQEPFQYWHVHKERRSR